MSRFGVRALKWPFESKDVEGTIQNLERCRGNISLALNIDQTVILQNVDDRTTLHQLPIAHGASFDSKAEEYNPTCLPNTREELLKEIDRWIDDPKSKTIFWLNGMAGTGKSTIARTVAHTRSKRGDLGASFFFKRGEIDRGNLNKLMSTLAHQLALSIPGVAFFIKKTLDANLAIVGKSVKKQFEKLIQEPLSEVAATPIALSSVVMVIDALDECDQEADTRLLINIFSQAKTLRPHLRVFLTSRPELPIRLGFTRSALKNRNNIGDRGDPCGSPACGRGRLSELWPLITMVAVRSEQKESIQRKRSSGIPLAFIRCSNLSLHTLYAPLTSKLMRLTT
ncbi:hypothetical protein FOC1_g10001095 [Fusarium oxysporum f. sp. cubense race 1]|nr:hypothetical protein FOC1_g10001095 [Fusarium oxysporum f. sp. cubense race 1]